MDTDLLIKTFHENIEYIAANHPNLYAKLEALDSAVVNGHYQEQYELVFDNGYFDVVEKKNAHYLYAKDSNQYADLAAASIDFDVTNNLFECAPEHKVSDEMLIYYAKLPLLQDYMSGIAPILHYIQKRGAGKRRLQSIEKFIFFGVGLGVHIATIDTKIHAKQYLIVEDDLELFRLSLFVTNYKVLGSEAKLYFSVFDEVPAFSAVCEAFLEDRYENNKYIKYFEMLSHAEDKRKACHLGVANQAHLRFSYASLLKQSLLPLENLQAGAQFLHKSVSLKQSILVDKPFLLLGAGPSLQKNIALLRREKNKFVLVAVSATLRMLEKENIVPDIIVHLDAFDASLKHFELGSMDFIKDAICLFSAKTSPIIMHRLPKDNIFFYEDSTQYITDSFRPSSPCVGSMAYQILLYLKVKNIYLLGLDLAVDSQTGMTHSSSHAYAKKLDLDREGFDEASLEYKKNLISVAGNKQSSVKTTPHFSTSIEMINLSTEMLKKEGQSIWNLGDGASFERMPAQELHDLQLQEIIEDKKAILQRDFLHSLCQSEGKNIQRVVQNKLQCAQNIRAKIMAFEVPTDATVASYKKALLALVNALKSDTNEDIEKVLDVYFRYLLPYIFDFFNKEDVVLGRKDFLQITKMIQEYLLKIV